MNAVDHLRRIPLLADLTAEEMVDVLRMATVVQFAPEQVEGHVRVSLDRGGKPMQLAMLGRGELVAPER